MLAEELSIKEYIDSLSGEAQAAAKSELFNIFRVNPWLSRLYGFYFDLGIKLDDAHVCQI